MSDGDLDDMLKKFPSHTDYRAMVFEHQRRQKLKDDEANKSRDIASQGRHTQTIDVGKKTLFWARLAVIAAVAVPILVALIADIPFSKLLRATSSQALPTSSPKIAPTVAPLESPLAVESPSAMPTATTTVSATSTPAP